MSHDMSGRLTNRAPHTALIPQRDGGTPIRNSRRQPLVHLAILGEALADSPILRAPTPEMIAVVPPGFIVDVNRRQQRVVRRPYA
jgi:hypothetical protein